MANPFVVTATGRHVVTITVVAHNEQEALRHVRRLLEFATTPANSRAKMSATRLRGLRLAPDPGAPGRRLALNMRRSEAAPQPPSRIVSSKEIFATIHGTRGVHHG